MLRIENGFLEEAAQKVIDEIKEKNIGEKNLSQAMKSFVKYQNDDGVDSKSLVEYEIMNFAREIDDIGIHETTDLELIKRELNTTLDKYFIKGILSSDNFIKVEDFTFNFYIPVNLDTLVYEKEKIISVITDSISFIDAAYMVGEIKKKEDSMYEVVADFYTEGSKETMLGFLNESKLFDGGDGYVISLCPKDK